MLQQVLLLDFLFFLSHIHPLRQPPPLQTVIYTSHRKPTDNILQCTTTSFGDKMMNNIIKNLNFNIMLLEACREIFYRGKRGLAKMQPSVGAQEFCYSPSLREAF
jgi:hypothetical protein